ncbi:MAG: PilZ domain-containing protein [Candidatus Omnitrophica bacterium]|nr:PilZ domain-containing protein [Candidatus Omnitrophota bacterium]
MYENRRHLRLREFLDVTWKVEGEEISGEGVVMNISKSGVLLQTDKTFRPPEKCVLSLESRQDDQLFSHKKAKMMWFRRIQGAKQPRFQCGLEFLTGGKDQPFQEWLQMKTDSLSNAQDVNILAHLAL